MRESEFAAVAQFAMHRRDRIAILRPGPIGMIAHLMYDASEVRSDEEVRAESSLVTEKEVTLAKTLIGALAGPFDPDKYHDKYRARLEALINEKVEGRQTAVSPTAPAARPVPDMMEALRKSIETIRKPAVKAGRPKRDLSKRTNSG